MSTSALIIPWKIRQSTQALENRIYSEKDIALAIEATTEKLVYFDNKVSAILRYAISTIITAENKYKRYIKEIIPNEKIFLTESISEKIRLLGNEELTLGKSQHYIQKSYIEIFNTLSLIFKKYINFLNNQKIYEDKDIEESLIEAISCGKYIEHAAFRNGVLGLFFPLQIYSYTMSRMLHSPPGIPGDPITRKLRSSAGGESSNYGEHILKSDIAKYLDKQSDKKKYSSINALLKDLQTELEVVLTDYKDRLGSPATRNGHTLTYGVHLTFNGLRRKFTHWCQDPNFKQRVERICPPRKKPSEPQDGAKKRLADVVNGQIAPA